MSANSTSPADIAGVLHLVEQEDYSPLVASALITFALWGMLYMQVYTYYSSDISKQDHLFVKITIGVAAILECYLTFLCTHITYFYLVYNFGNPAELAIRPWSLNTIFISREIQMQVIRCLFLRRLLVLCRGSKIVIGWILLWSLLELGAEIAFTVQFCSLGPLLTYPKSLYKTVYIAQASGLVTDISLAAALCYYLHKSRTGGKGTDTIIQLFILYCISTTAIVVVAGVISTVLFLVFGSNYFDFPCYVAQTKLYFIAYMVTLNGRDKLRTRREDPQSINLPSFMHASAQIHSGGGGTEKPNFGSISVGTTAVTYTE